jgi:hypothetical protein
MPAFKIQLNGKKLCIASLDARAGVLGAHVSSVCRGEAREQKTLLLHVGGLVSATGEHLVWHQAHPINVGDKLSVEVVEMALSDKPSSRKKSNPVADLKARKQYVRKMAKEFGWKIQTK